VKKTLLLSRESLSWLSGIIAAIVIALAVTVHAGIGGDDDPVVSKSYVDNLFNSLKTQAGEAASLGSGAVDTLTSAVLEKIEPILAGVVKTEVGKQAAYVPVSANAGQVVVGGEGTEIILRSGVGYAHVSGADGVVNATTGKELKNNDPCPKNNILITPRADGRGVRVTENAWFIIKGSYTIQ
jgi:hypothetical protein